MSKYRCRILSVNDLHEAERMAERLPLDELRDLAKERHLMDVRFGRCYIPGSVIVMAGIVLIIADGSFGNVPFWQAVLMIAAFMVPIVVTRIAMAKHRLSCRVGLAYVLRERREQEREIEF